MFWNFFMHILIGLFGSTEWFTLTTQGVLMSVGVVSLTQASEMIRLYMEEKKKIETDTKNNPGEKLEAFKEKFKKELPAAYLQNLVMYTAVVLFSAEIGRTSGYGL